MNKISIIIHTYNEEKNIAQCIDSAKLLSEKIIVVDMESTDKTVEIAKNLGVPVYTFPKSNYVEPAREFGIKQAKTDWVLILDADERMTEELAKEINSLSIFQTTNYELRTTSYYKIPRKNIFSQIKWLKHGGWWPDYQIRLINKKYFIDWPKRIHSTPIIKGEMGYLKNPLVHYFHGNLDDMVKKTVIFEDIESELLYKAGKKTTTITFFRKFLAELYRRLIKSLGFLDGTIGIIESVYQAFSKTITYLFLYEKQSKKPHYVGKVGLYNPYLDTLGGGEKHILSILEVFAEKGYEVNIFWDKNLTTEINKRFSLHYINIMKFLPSPFKKGFSALQALWTLRTFDYFFYVTDGSYFFSSAKNNFIFSMAPDKKLFNMNIINKIKLFNYRFISISTLTHRWLKKWKINSIIIEPCISDKTAYQKIDFSKKEKIILTVGRFFSHLHSKRHDLAIKAFKNLKKRSDKFSEYKLILAGGLKDEDQTYFNKLKKLAENDPTIIFKPNISLIELEKLYKLSTYYWHFAGYGIDEKINPNLVEHFGITPIEAMSSGCLTFCYPVGGPRELIQEEKNGFLFRNIDELINKMILIDDNKIDKEKIMTFGKQFVKNNFSYQIFREKVLNLIK